MTAESSPTSSSLSAISLTALAQSAQAMTLVDQDNIVIIANTAMQSLIRNHDDVFTALPEGASETALIGQAAYQLLNDGSALQSKLNRNDSAPHTVNIDNGDTLLKLRICPLDTGDSRGVKLIEWVDETISRRNAGFADSISEHKATIEFNLEGIVIRANENFAKTMGYTMEELIGMHHSSFVPEHIRKTPEYQRHWTRLANGEEVSGKFPRLTKDGRKIWMEASYDPIRAADGTPFKVIKIASDVTEIETIAFDRKAVMDAISRSQSVFEMDPHGTILSINENLLHLLGRSESSMVGRSLADMLDSDFQSGAGYNDMWTALRRGTADSRVYPMYGPGRSPIYLQGSITPVLDRNGTVFKFISCLTDATHTETQRQEQQHENERMAHQQAQVVDEMRRGLTALAKGELAIQIDKNLGEDYESLRKDFNHATKRLNDTISTIIGNTDGIRNEASEIARAADDLSRRTESQAATLEQTSASLEELTASVKSAAEGASKANQNVADAQRSAEQSGTVVDEAIRAMSEIEGSSTKISQIIGVIDDIAFQTNLLALNAGVEAARAGDAGRGFAVVASEVRALAQRSSEAAKEIKTLISTSSEQVSSGVDLVGQTGTALKDILASVTSISKLVSDIANTASEQSVGIGEINTAVNQIDQVTQQNAAMVEESTAASHALMQEAEQLAKVVSQFNVSAASASATSRPTIQASATMRPAPARPATTQPASVARPTPTPQSPPATHGNTAMEIEEVEDWEEF